MEDARRVTAMLSLFNIKENAEIFWEWGHHTTRNVLVVVFLTIVFFLAVSLLVLVELGGVTFKSMIMFKSLRIDFSFVEEVCCCCCCCFYNCCCRFSSSYNLLGSKILRVFLLLCAFTNFLYLLSPLQNPF